MQRYFQTVNGFALNEHKGYIGVLWQTFCSMTFESTFCRDFVFQEEGNAHEVLDFARKKRL